MTQPPDPAGSAPDRSDDGRKGTVAVEYAVIIGTLAVAIIAGFTVLSGRLAGLMELLPL